MFVIFKNIYKYITCQFIYTYIECRDCASNACVKHAKGVQLQQIQSALKGGPFLATEALVENDREAQLAESLVLGIRRLQADPGDLICLCTKKGLDLIGRGLKDALLLACLEIARPSQPSCPR